MPRNTKLLVAFLTIFAGLVAGLNVMRWLRPPELDVLTENTPKPSSATTTPSPMYQIYESKACQIELTYPSSYIKSEDASGSAILSSLDKKNAIFVTCPENLKPPTGSNTTSENIKIASMSAKIYHEKMEDGNVLDTLVIRHPNTKQNVFVAGTGQTIKDVINSIKIVQ